MRLSWVALFVLCLSLFLLANIPVTNAKIAVHTHSGKWPQSKWVFLDKFCFDSAAASNPGRISWAASGDLRGVSLAVYDDQEFSFPKLRGKLKDVSCQDKINSTFAKTVKKLDESPSYEIVLHEHYSRFWFLALSMCDRESNGDIDILVHFKNPGGWWRQEFSKDKQGVLELYLSFLILYTIVGATYAFGIFQLFRKAPLHAIVKVFAAALYIKLLGIFLVWVHYTVYASNGSGVFGLKDIGVLLEGASELLFIMLLLVMATGWGISSHELLHKWVILTCVAILTALYLVLYIWAEANLNAQYNTYLYDTPPGITLAVMRIPLLGFFVYLCIRSLLAETEQLKKRFYGVFACAYSIWFLILPFIVLIALSFDPWNRYIAVESLSMVFYFISVVGMCVLLWPKVADKIFVIQKASSSKIYETL